VQEW